MLGFVPEASRKRGSRLLGEPVATERGKQHGAARPRARARAWVEQEIWIARGRSQTGQADQRQASDISQRGRTGNEEGQGVQVENALDVQREYLILYARYSHESRARGPAFHVESRMPGNRPALAILVLPGQRGWWRWLDLQRVNEEHNLLEAQDG